jgi:hypothetical protein
MERLVNAAMIASMCLAPVAMSCVVAEDGQADPAVSQVEQAVRNRCHWQGASVHEGEWLECPRCVWRFCQCMPDGSWGNCRNDRPSGGACDWTNPDWTDPACSEGGRVPCDWSNPDWENPDCQENSPPGSGARSCRECHGDSVPRGTPPRGAHSWL